MKTLKEIRIENMLTQKELASFFGVSHRTIYNVESDSTNIKDSLLSKYIKAFSVKYDEIFLGSKYEIYVFEKGKKDKIYKMINENLNLESKIG